MAYTKLHQSILESTIWSEDSDIRIVWITLLAMADRHGEVTSTIPGLARRANVSLEACQAALEKFLGPDAFSRTTDDDGRRLVPIEGGWHLLNYEKYRLEASKDDRKAKNAARAKRYRDRKRNADGVTRNAESVTRHPTITHERDIAEAEAEGDISTGRDSESHGSTESLTQANRARAKTSRPSRVARSDFAPPPGRVNGAHTADTRRVPLPADWQPPIEAKREIRAMPKHAWMTKDVFDTRTIEFAAWAATEGKLFRPDERVIAWKGFMMKTKRDQFPEIPNKDFN